MVSNEEWLKSDGPEALTAYMSEEYGEAGSTREGHLRLHRKLIEAGHDLWAVKAKKDGLAIRNWLKETWKAEATQRTYMAFVRCAITYRNDNETEVDLYPVLEVLSIRKSKKKGQRRKLVSRAESRITNEQFEKIMDEKMRVEDTVYLAVIRATGMRVAECARLQVEDIRFETTRTTIWVPGTKNQNALRPNPLPLESLASRKLRDFVKKSWKGDHFLFIKQLPEGEEYQTCTCTEIQCPRCRHIEVGLKTLQNRLNERLGKHGHRLKNFRRTKNQELMDAQWLPEDRKQWLGHSLSDDEGHDSYAIDDEEARKALILKFMKAQREKRTASQDELQQMFETAEAEASKLATENERLKKKVRYHQKQFIGLIKQLSAKGLLDLDEEGNVALA